MKIEVYLAFGKGKDAIEKVKKKGKEVNGKLFQVKEGFGKTKVSGKLNQDLLYL